MTTIALIGKIKISVYADDHNPPHFHIVSQDTDAIVRIRDMVVIKGEKNHAHVRSAVEWANGNREKIALAWVEMNG